MKPEWKNAPDWAQYLSKDTNGGWFWTNEKPILIDGSWRVTEFAKVESAAMQIDVSKTIEKRPEVKE
jgi:hypothetical protein